MIRRLCRGARRGAALSALFLSASLLAGPATAAGFGGPNAFEFVAMGDMPYNLPADYTRFETLIRAVNGVKPAFSVHVGDIKSGSTPCTDAMFQRVKDQFGLFDQPLVYTPGDNEWTDCHREKAGRFDPDERLAKIRAMFFAAPVSFGKTALPLVRQGDIDPAFATYVENVRWAVGKVLFVTVHVIGSNNNLPDSKGKTDEYTARNTANIAWIKAGFAEASKTGAEAVVFVMQADPEFTRKDRTGNGFNDTLEALTDGTKAFRNPVLLVQGDSHEMVIDQPLTMPDGKTTLETFTRLQVMGDGHVHAVRVLVDPDSPGVFSFQPLIVPENLRTP